MPNIIISRITDIYLVAFWVGERGSEYVPGSRREMRVALTDNYTDFEQVRELVASRANCTAEQVRVLQLTRVDV